MHIASIMHIAPIMHIGVSDGLQKRKVDISTAYWNKNKGKDTLNKVKGVKKLNSKFCLKLKR